MLDFDPTDYESKGKRSGIGSVAWVAIACRAVWLVWRMVHALSFDLRERGPWVYVWAAAVCAAVVRSAFVVPSRAPRAPAAPAVDFGAKYSCAQMRSLKSQVCLLGLLFGGNCALKQRRGVFPRGTTGAGCSLVMSMSWYVLHFGGRKAVEGTGSLSARGIRQAKPSLAEICDGSADLCRCR